MKIKLLNKDAARRSELLQYHYTRSSGGIHYFRDLPLKLLKQLVAEGFADEDDRQNDAPSIKELIVLGDKAAGLGYKVYFDGYSVDVIRTDYRVSIDSIFVEFGGLCDPQLFADFSEWEDSADIFDDGTATSTLHCWWD